MIYDTLGAMIDSGHRIAVYCDRPGLAERLGRDHGAMHDDLAPKLRCSKCGSKAVSIRVHPPTTPSGD